MAFYGSGTLYNSGQFYIGGASMGSNIPQDLRFYRTSQDGIYVFWWGFLPQDISPSLSSANFDLELDVASPFIVTTVGLPFTITSVTDGTHLVVGSTTYMAPNDILIQGSHVSTIVSVTDLTHIVVNTTSGWILGNALDTTAPVLFVNDTSGMSVTDSIFQGTHSTSIVSIPSSTQLIVNSTSGWVIGPASAITFDTPSLVTFTSTTAITYQNGNVRKGYAVPVAPRESGVIQTWYARVRNHTGSFISDWSTTLIWTIPENTQQAYAEALMNSLPDAHVYGKGDLLKPVDERNTNLYLVENMYGNQLDKVYYTNFLTQTDNYIDLCVDENLYENFGVLFEFPKPNNLQYVDYRWILINLFLASLVGSTNEAIILVVSSFTGVPPLITNVRDLNDFFLNTIQDDPIVPNAPQTVFDTVFPYIDSSLIVEQLSTLTVNSTTGFVAGPASDSTSLISFVITSINSSTELGIASVPYVSSVRQLNPGDTIIQNINTAIISAVIEGGLVSSSDYTTDGVQSKWTMHVATTATLQATYNIGNPAGPFPVVFDSMSGETTLTGLVTFTNGNIIVGGSGTLFTTELAVNDQITDPTGIYLGTVEHITSDTSLQLLNNWFGPTEVTTAYKLQYTDISLPPPIIWDIHTLASGVIITVFNPGQFILN